MIFVYQMMRPVSLMACQGFMKSISKSPYKTLHAYIDKQEGVNRARFDVSGNVIFTKSMLLETS